MEWLSDPQVWIAFLTLLALEIVLGIDNIIFISILAARLPHDQQGRARYVGLGLALFIRVALLFSLSCSLPCLRTFPVAGSKEIKIPLSLIM